MHNCQVERNAHFFETVFGEQKILILKKRSEFPRRVLTLVLDFPQVKHFLDYEPGIHCQPG